MNIREAIEDDAERIAEIYRPYVENTAVSFEYDAPDAEEIKRRMRKTLERYPYLVAEEEGRVVGYAYAGAFVAREAYRYCAELSIYLDENCRGNGIGRALYAEMERLLKNKGIVLLYACIGVTEREDDPYLTNASEKFHERMGYRLVGTHSLCGYKFDRWYSMVWMEKQIGERK